MLIRFRATPTPAPLRAPGGVTMYGLFATDNESSIPVYLAEKDDGDPNPTQQDCFCGKTIPARNDANGALQNQAQDVNNGIDPARVWGCTDPADAIAVSSTVPAGTIVFNSALNCRDRLAAPFTVPAASSSVSIMVPDTTLSVTKDVDSVPTAFPLLAVADVISIGDALFEVVSIDSATTATVTNLGAPCAFLTPFG